VSRGRPTHLRCRAEVPPPLPQVRRQRRLPLGTIDEATETTTSKSTTDLSDSSSVSVGNPVDEPEVESGAVGPEPEMMATAENFYEPLSTSGVPTALDDQDAASDMIRDRDVSYFKTYVSF